MKSKFRRGVSRNYELEKSISYNIECACGSEEHAVKMEVSYSKFEDWPDEDLTINFYKKMSLWHKSGNFVLWSICDYIPYGYKIADWLDENWPGLVTVVDKISEIYWRIKYSLKILWTGNIEIDDEILLTDPEHVNSFIEAVNEGYNLMSEYKKSKESEE